MDRITRKRRRLRRLAINTIPDEITQFVHDHIDSVWQLELLVHLWRNRGSAFSLADIAALVYMDAGSVEHGLRRLSQCGIVIANAKYQYQPITSELDKMVSSVVAVYLERRVAMTEIIYSTRASSARMLLCDEASE